MVNLPNAAFGENVCVCVCVGVCCMTLVSLWPYRHRYVTGTLVSCLRLQALRRCVYSRRCPYLYNLLILKLNGRV